MTGDVTIARFPSAGAADRWRVSLLGHTHFLTDQATAHRILALAGSDAGGVSYRQAYDTYRRSLGTAPESIDSFIAWCEKHRQRLEGLAATPDGHPLRLRRLLLGDALCARICRPLGALFRPGCMSVLWGVSLAVIAAYLLQRPPSDLAHFWPAAAITLAGVLIHEFGHVTACIRMGARQGGIGLGLYWIWPAFYADVRGSWVLSSRQRAVVSLGGLYFQSLYVAALALGALATRDGTLALALAMSFLLMATTLNPVFKYDGYWIVSDLLNVPNLHTRIGAHLRGMLGRSQKTVPWRSPMTAVSLGFALVASAYLLYVFHAMAVAGMHGAARVPALWSGLAGSLAAPSLRLGPLAAAGAALGSVVLQLAFVVMGTVLLGLGSIRCAAGLFSSRKPS